MVIHFDCQTQGWLLKWSAGCYAGTDPDLSSSNEQQHCEAVLAQKRCVLVFGDDEALEGKSHQTVVAYQIAQHYCLFLNIGVCVC